VAEASIPCWDPECLGEAEQEHDGDLAFWVCDECGGTFGFEHERESEVCAAGVPLHGLPPAAVAAVRLERFSRPQPVTLRLKKSAP
jgi:hypothetical protein